MASQKAPRGESTYHCFWGQISTTCSNATEVAQWGAPSFSRPQPVTDSASKIAEPIDWLFPPTLYSAVPPSATCTVQICAASAENRALNLIRRNRLPLTAIQVT